MTSSGRSARRNLEVSALVRAAKRMDTARRSLLGATAGLLATVPMTAFMAILYRRLPPRERYPLPPREITMHAAEAVGLEDQLEDPAARSAATLVAHFGYGAAAGAIYGPLAGKSDLPPLAEGAAYGLTVWASSYLGVLPALGLLSPATEHPKRRTALMIAANVLWGAALGVGVAALRKRS